MPFTREALLSSLRTNGDSYIYYISPMSGKVKYHIGTSDFSQKTSPYIAAKLARFRQRNTEHVLVFCYDIDDFKYIDPTSVQNLTPLNTVV